MWTNREYNCKVDVIRPTDEPIYGTLIAVTEGMGVIVLPNGRLAPFQVSRITIIEDGVETPSVHREAVTQTPLPSILKGTK